jgi:hypothetical protein
VFRILGQAAAEPPIKRSSSLWRQLHDAGTIRGVVGNNVGHGGKCVASLFVISTDGVVYYTGTVGLDLGRATMMLLACLVYESISANTNPAEFVEGTGISIDNEGSWANNVTLQRVRV